MSSSVTWRHDNYPPLNQPEPMPIRPTRPKPPPNVCARPGCGLIAEIQLRWLSLSEAALLETRLLDLECQQILTAAPDLDAIWTDGGPTYNDPQPDRPRATHRLETVRFCLGHGREAWRQLRELGIYATYKKLTTQE